MTTMNSTSAKKAFIAAGVVAYLVGTAAATLYGSAALYMLFHKQRPAGIDATTIFGFWDAHAADPKERKKLLLAAMVPPLVLLVLLPLGIASSARRPSAATTWQR